MMSSTKKEVVPGRKAFRVVLWLAALTATLFGSNPAAAQSTFASVVGIIQDKSGATVGEAEVSVRGIEDNSVRTAVSDEAGTYKVGNLKPGRYEVSINKAS